MRTDYDRFVGDAERRGALRKEEMILEVTEATADAMERSGVSQSELATRLGKTRGAISQILAGRNVTIGTVAEIADAIGCSVQIRLSLKDAPRRPRPAAGVTRGVRFIGGRGVHAHAGARGTRAEAKSRLGRKL